MLSIQPGIPVDSGCRDGDHRVRYFMKQGRLAYPIFFLAVLAGPSPGFAAPADGAAPRTRVVYLSGHGKDDAKRWDFCCTGGRRSGVWTTIPVPSCWELQGFGRYEYGLEARPSKQHPHPYMADEHGLYRTSFDAPAAWAGDRVQLVFQGVMTDATVRVNGRLAGPVHRGAFYRFAYDITPLLRFGRPNRLEVDVAKKSANASVNAAEREGDYWNFGGIFRPVYLKVLPPRFIDRVAIDARADGAFTGEVRLGGTPPSGRETLEAQIVGRDGQAAGPPAFEAVPAGAAEITVRTRLAHPRLWTAETPNLYRVRLTLLAGTRPEHQLATEFGFRTFEVRPGDGLYLNGVKIKLKGCCRHSFWPDSGRTLSRAINDEDARTIKAANMNAVRMSHYPPDADFLRACDEVGLYVLDELGGWHGAYDTPTGRKLIGEMVRRDVNHPCVLFWDNGNEGGFNPANDGQFDRWDPQHRPVLHPWATFSHVATYHYRTYPETVRLCAGPEIFMPTEFLHGMYDGGAGAGLEDYWNVMYRSPTCAGGFIWAYLDESVVRTDEGGRLDSKNDWAPDGIVGPYRQKEGSYFTIRQVWCPVQAALLGLLPARLASGSAPTLALENRFDFTNLAQCRFHWSLATFPDPSSGLTGHLSIAAGTLTGPDVPPHGAGLLALPPGLPWSRAQVLYVTAFDPAGRSLWTWSWPTPRGDATSAREAPVPVNVKIADGNEIGIGDLRVAFDPRTGELARLSRSGRPFPLRNGPRLVAFIRQGKRFVALPARSTLKSFNQGRENGELVVTAAYSGPLRFVTWRIPASGPISVDYETAFHGPVDILGVTFDFPEDHVLDKRWLGAGAYHGWRNRLKGTTLDVWQDAYNNTVPGDTWIYPEFKGFFADWRWMVFDTTDGALTFWNGVRTPALAGGDSYFGVYRPNDGRVNPILPLPALGIGIYQVIPAMGSKTETPDLMGPHSRTPVLSGAYHGSFRFEVTD